MPDKLLYVMSNTCKPARLPKLSGMVSCKLFRASKRNDREEKFPNELGMLPERLLLVKLRYFKGEDA